MIINMLLRPGRETQGKVKVLVAYLTENLKAFRTISEIEAQLAWKNHIARKDGDISHAKIQMNDQIIN